MSTTENTQVAERTPTTVKEFLALPAYKARFGEVLGQRAPQFMASLINLTQDRNLAQCEPKSVIASAMIAAVLDFPIEKSLGFAHIVPYGGVAQFQMAAKGYVQLALRSGQYQRLNAKPVNAEAFGGFDEVGEPRINWDLLDDTKPAVGYVVAWRLTNGFTKVAYWTKAKVENHASQFSQAFKKKKMDSPWFTNFDKMALKTVVMNELRSWGILSVQMQTAMRHDMGAQKDVDADVEYIDADADTQTTGEATPQAAPDRPAAPPRTKKGAATVAENPVLTKADAKAAVAVAERGKVVEGEFTETPPPATPPAEATPAEQKATPAPAAEAPKPRVFLKDAEKIIATCFVKSVTCMVANVTGKLTPSVQAEVTGDFNGVVYHFGGATEGPEPDKILAPISPWAVGATVKLDLLGKLNQKSVKNDANGKPDPSTGKVLVQVLGITEGAPAAQTMEVG